MDKWRCDVCWPMSEGTNKLLFLYPECRRISLSMCNTGNNMAMATNSSLHDQEIVQSLLLRVSGASYSIRTNVCFPRNWEKSGVKFTIHILVPKPDRCSLRHQRQIAQRYSAGLQAGWSGVRVPVVAGNFSLYHRVQTGSGAHPASYPMGTRGSFPGGNAASKWSWALTSI
jgi:hypothetical protein